MAPDLAHPDDAPANLTGRAVLAFAQIIVATGVLVFAFYEAMSWLKAHHASYGAMMAATAVYAALVIGLVVLWSRGAAARACMTTTPAAKRYRRRMLLSALAYTAALLIAIGINGRHLAPGVLAYLIAALPGIAVSGMFVSMGLYLREETDEFQRSVQIESSLWATGAVLMVSAVWGFLDMFRLVPRVEAWVIAPLWSAFLGFANVIVRRRYR